MTTESDELREQVRARYAEAAITVTGGSGCGCGTGSATDACCGPSESGSC